MSRQRLMLGVPLLLALGACTWVKMEPQGAAVRVARASDSLSACTRKGEVSVSVRDKVGLYHRNDIKVRDELEVLARNEAAKMHADTIKPLAEPTDGSQPWGAYQCGANKVPSARPSAPASSAPGNAQTFPIQGH